MFLAHIKQDGEGCDYTLACGETTVKLKAATMADAQEEVRQMLTNTYTFKDERRLQTATIYEVSDTFTVPVDDWYAQIMLEANQAETERRTAARRAQFEKLKREFGEQ
ncbi:hypothetical protein AB4Y45_33040 [Paraburkholderia sp. EG287A]|uniref:hypothetical protein n=1 Tax=Paraburkholderia sp. EG287A TaxID=3237012 RepID=UPI0034D1CEEE